MPGLVQRFRHVAGRGAPASKAFSARIAGERSRIHARMMMAAAPTQLAFWLLASLVLMGSVAQSAIAAVLGVLSLLTVIVTLIARFLMRLEPEDDRLVRVRVALKASVILTALIAGASAALLFPRLEDLTQLLVTLSLIAAYAVAIAAHHASPSTLMGVGLGMTGPVAVAWMVEGTPQGFLIGATLAVLLLLPWYISAIAGAAVDDAIRSRLRIAELSARLEARGCDLEAAVRAKTQFLAAASHDLRQPVTSLNLILSSVDRQADERAAKEEAEPGPKQLSDSLKDLSARMRPAVKAMGDILDSMLEMSRLEAGLVRTNIVPIDLRDLLLSVQIEYAPRAQAGNLQLTTQVAAVSIKSDRDLLGRIVRNLVDNALKYTPAGSVTIQAQMEGDHCVIAVEDTGLGIPPDLREQIFEDYFQAANPNRDRGKGFGLGLSIVKRLVTLLGGVIRVDSEVGKGSRFEVRLPTEAVEVVPPKEPAARLTIAQALAGKSRLMVIDDDVLIRDALTVVLEGVRIETRFAANPQEGIALVATAGFAADVAIVDYRLPGGMNGLDVVASLVSRNASMAAVLITGDLDPAVVSRAAHLNAALVSKPFGADDLAIGIADARQMAGARTAAAPKMAFAKTPLPGRRG